MKITILLVVFTLFLAQTESLWLPDIFGIFTNTTSEFAQYVKQRGREFRRMYTDGMREKIASIFKKPESSVTENNLEETKKIEETEQKIEDTADQVRRKRKGPVNPPENNIRKAAFKIKATTATPASVRRCSDDDDPMDQMTTPQLIAAHGYPAESHTIVTDDGYVLTIHRIPYRKNNTVADPRKTVLLHHGLLGSSADWVIPGPGKALAYILSDAGYDVWMANARGNTYSRTHISRPVSSYAFWNFTFHDISQHDLPAVIDYITELKSWNVKINYIGHSMGTTVLFALLSTKTHYNKVLRAGYALAPVAYMTDIRSPIKIFAKFANNIDYLLKLLGANEFLPQSVVLKWLSKHFCELNHYEEVICENSMFVLCGADPKQFNQTLLPMILGHTPAGASTKTVVHYAQMIHNEGRFQQYDYGEKGNYAQYGTPTPPEYPVHQITLPMALLSADNDWLAGNIDVTNLYLQLANPIEHYVVPFEQFNHLDFLYAIDAPKLVYDKLLGLLEDGITSKTYLYNTMDFYNVK
ncbi:alpha/beta-hydrolase lipase region domain-containing protein [Phthorimaea operculella]|nr:alpha/beta-hydrolase lipase region domain-containing protein [Phthorimaea operculella]